MVVAHPDSLRLAKKWGFCTCSEALMTTLRHCVPILPEWKKKKKMKTVLNTSVQLGSDFSRPKHIFRSFLYRRGIFPLRLCWWRKLCWWLFTCRKILFLDQHISCCCFKYPHISKTHAKNVFWRFFSAFRISIFLCGLTPVNGGWSKTMGS